MRDVERVTRRKGLYREWVITGRNLFYCSKKEVIYKQANYKHHSVFPLINSFSLVADVQTHYLHADFTYSFVLTFLIL